MHRRARGGVAYGQRHAVEIEAARRVARSMEVDRHVELSIDLRAFDLFAGVNCVDYSGCLD